MTEREPDYYSAAVCRQGHVETDHTEFRRDKLPKFCPRCGSDVLIKCAECGWPIRGAKAGDYQTVYTPPDYCVHCGALHPWASRAGRINMLQRIVADADLDEASRLRAREQLEALSDADLDDDEQARLWKRFRNAAPAVWSSDPAQKVIGTLVETGVRGMIR